MREAVFAAGSLYDRFRRGQARVVTDSFELRRVRFVSDSPRLDRLQWAENQEFVYPMFLPANGGPFGELLVILNGLNDSSYRKFFPWAASIAMAGLPVAIFPSAYLMNRRPRSWITPTASNAAWQRRLAVAPDSATPVNAVLSERVSNEPRGLLDDVLQTAGDLRQLLSLVSRSASQNSDGYDHFAAGATCHFLGYSLGGYLALALKLQDEAFAASRVITFCAGASSAALASHEHLAPVSHFILDQHASDTLLRELLALSQFETTDVLTNQLLELWTGTSEITRARIRALDRELTIIAGAGDRVVPTHGILQNLGRLDAELPLGMHEYPFNVGAPQGRDLARVAAKSHCIGSSYEPAFLEFLDAVLVGAGWTAAHA